MGSKYFQLDKGKTVLELRDGVWLRWDPYDGLVSSSIFWEDYINRLTELSQKEAEKLIGEQEWI